MHPAGPHPNHTFFSSGKWTQTWSHPGALFCDVFWSCQPNCYSKLIGFSLKSLYCLALLSHLGMMIQLDEQRTHQRCFRIILHLKPYVDSCASLPVHVDITVWFDDACVSFKENLVHVIFIYQLRNQVLKSWHWSAGAWICWGWRAYVSKLCRFRLWYLDPKERSLVGIGTRKPFMYQKLQVPAKM